MARTHWPASAFVEWANLEVEVDVPPDEPPWPAPPRQRPAGSLSTLDDSRHEAKRARQRESMRRLRARRRLLKG